MNKNEYRNLINEVLKSDERIWNEAKTELNETKLIDLVEKIDEIVIGLLLENEKLREKFFVKVKEVYVFKINDFRFFIEENKVENSFTKYKNQIGLTDGKRFLKDTNDIVLNWPYKDCILEGGQTKEDGLDTYFEFDENEKNYEPTTAKRKEIFYNEVLAADEIDRLIDPKALVNWKRYTINGEEKVTELKRDENGTIRENLIIKGNNLLALHSINKEFIGKVKLIYIDPPFNTGNDSFKYNDNFNHSTWLTFINNRLEIAQNLLNESGLILVQCDYNESAYLKILLDSIFGRDNYINTISVQSSTPSGVKISHANKKILKSQDFIHVYKKNKTEFYPQYIKKNKWDTHYMFYIDEETNTLKNLVTILKEKKILSVNQNLNDFNIDNEIHKSFYLKNGEFIVRKSTHENAEIKDICNNKFKDIIYKNNKGNFYLNNDMLQPISKSFHEIFNGQNIEIDIANLLCDFWYDIDFQNTQNQGGVSFPAGKKPEQLLYRIIKLCTVEGDIVLDYHLGSGTTAAVAHKMNRQFIGIEQLDYAENDSVNRLINVIQGEKSGISNAINWTGGGDFVYFELAKWNVTAKEKINNCVSLEELISLFDEMYNNYFLNYNLKISEFKEKVIKEENFINLPLDEQKKMLLAMLDNNQMFVNYTEMEDSKFGISEYDKNLTNQFYGEK